MLYTKELLPDIAKDACRINEASLSDIQTYLEDRGMVAVFVDPAEEKRQQRVADEKEELDKKAKALSEFIGHNPIFDTIDPAEQERLKVQNDIMWQYSEILGARIAAF